jgi:hypothetical protein
MDHRTRICLWIILVGLANFLVYSGLYWLVGGEAVNGRVEQWPDHMRYFLQTDKQVSHAVFLYSGIHSISIWPTVAAILLAMLTLAKDRIVSSMHSGVVRGRAMVTILAVVIALTAALMTFVFIHQFTGHLNHPQAWDAAARAVRLAP